MESVSSSRYPITFLSRDLNTTSTAHCAVLMNYLRSVGYPVNLITEERPRGNEFRHDHTIRTFSIDTPIRFSRTRHGVLSDFADVCRGSLFVLFTSSLFFCDDVDTLTSQGHKVIAIEDTPVMTHLVNGYTSLYRRCLDTLATLPAVLTFSASSFAHLRESGIGKAVYVPFIFPFTKGEFLENESTDCVALVFRNKSLSRDTTESIFSFVKENCPDKNIIVKGLSSKDFDTDDRITFSDEDYINYIGTCSKAFLFYPVPFYDDFAVSLSARLIPFTFFSSFDDASLNALTLDKLCVPEDTIDFSLDDQENACRKYSDLFDLVMSDADFSHSFKEPEYSDEGFLNTLSSLREKYNFFSVSAKNPSSPSKLKQLLSLPSDYFVYLESKRYAKYKIHQTSPETVRKCQLLALYMLDEFERICKKHSLRYYVAAGSLLGAVRHGGMIPWDDDIDVTMPRPDYEAFLKIAQTELSDDMILPVKNFPYGFTRIMMKDTKVNRIIKQTGPHGVFLDVLPLDGAATDEAEAEKHSEQVSKLLRLMHLKALPIPRLQFDKASVYYFAYHLYLKSIPKNLLLYRFKKLTERFSTEDSDCWICLPGTYGYEKERFPKEYWGEPVMMMYNGTMRPFMREWEEYLTLHYGDYMRTPALLFRRTHGSLSIELGKYEDMSVEELENYLDSKRKDAVNK